jgi:hypothetical protein
VGAVLLILEPPKGDHEAEPISCEVEGPDGVRHNLDVRPPHAVRTNGVPNEYYFVVFPRPEQGERGPLTPGPYRVVWRSLRARPGTKLLRIRRFTVTGKGKLR